MIFQLFSNFEIFLTKNGCNSNNQQRNKNSHNKELTFEETIKKRGKASLSLSKKPYIKKTISNKHFQLKFDTINESQKRVNSKQGSHREKQSSKTFRNKTEPNATENKRNN